MAVGARIESAGWLYTTVVLLFELLQADFGVLALRRCHSLRRNNASSGVRIFFHCRVWYHKEPCATVFAYYERINMYFCTKQLHEIITFAARSLYGCCTSWMDSNITWRGRDLRVTGLLQINPPIFWSQNQPVNMVTVWGLNSWVDIGLPTPLDLTFGDFRCRNKLRFACSSDR